MLGAFDSPQDRVVLAAALVALERRQRLSPAQERVVDRVKREARMLQRQTVEVPVSKATRHVSVAEAAGQLDVSERQVRRYLSTGRLQGIKTGNSWLVEVAA